MALLKALSPSCLFFLLSFWLLGATAHVERNLKTIQQIYNLTVFPNNVPIATNGGSAVPKGLFNPNATGRVSPVGNFTGFEDSIEYFFALAPIPGPENGNQAFYKADVVEYTSGCPEVAASTVYLSMGEVDDSGKFIGNSTGILKEVAFWRFDSSGAVLQYDAWIPNLERWVEVTTGLSSSPPVQAAFIQALCSVIQKRCTGGNQQYESLDDCTSTLAKKNFGSYDETWGDTVVCRNIHSILTQLRPEVHCPHVGPVGGNGPDNFKCVDIDYRLDYFDDPLLFGAPEGSPFTCPGANVP